MDAKLGCPTPSKSSEAQPCLGPIRRGAALLLAAALALFGARTVHARPPYPILLVHGISSDDSTWDDVVSALAPRYIVSKDSLTFHACLNYDANPTVNNLAVRRLSNPAPSSGVDNSDIAIYFPPEEPLASHAFYRLNFEVAPNFAIGKDGTPRNGDVTLLPTAGEPFVAGRTQVAMTLGSQKLGLHIGQYLTWSDGVDAPHYYRIQSFSAASPYDTVLAIPPGELDPWNPSLRLPGQFGQPVFELAGRSNQEAIVKQAVAIREAIREILLRTGAPKVVLVTHSMGGLAARAYLQWGRSETQLIGSLWAEQVQDGHHVAKLVTVGTPHLGSQVASEGFVSLLGPLGLFVDPSSNASRDLAYDYDSLYSSSPPQTPLIKPGVFLFGGPESLIPSSYESADVNADNATSLSVTGLNSATALTDNPSMPLPRDVDYFWIVGKWPPLNGDGCVRADRQVLSVIGEQLTIHAEHAHTPLTPYCYELADTDALIEALDEGDDLSHAYDLNLNQPVEGFISCQYGNQSGTPSGCTDQDYYRLLLCSPTTLKLSIGGSGVDAGAVTSLALLDAAGNVLVSAVPTVSPLQLAYTVSAQTLGTYFVRVQGIGQASDPGFTEPFGCWLPQATLATPYTLSATTAGTSVGLTAGSTSLNVGQATTLRASVTNNLGLPAGAGIRVSFSATAGHLSGCAPGLSGCIVPTDASGIAAVTFSSLTAGTLRVVASAETGDSQSLDLVFVGGGAGSQLFPVHQMTLAPGGKVFGVAFSPDGLTLVASGYGPETITAWNAGSGSQTWSVTSHHNKVSQVSFSADGSTLAVATDRGVEIRSAGTGAFVCDSSLSTPATFVATYTAGTSLFAATSANTFRATACGALGFNSTASFERESHLDYSAAKRYVAGGDANGNVLVFDATSGVLVRSIPIVSGGNAYDVSWTADGSRLVAVGKAGTVAILNTSGSPSSWSTATCGLPALPGRIMSAVWVDHDTKLAIGGDQAASGRIEIIDPATCASLRYALLDGVVQEMAWNEATGDLAAGTSSGTLYLFRPFLAPDGQAPTLTVFAPGDGVSTRQPTVLTTGRVQDDTGVATFTINGVAVPLDAAGGFSQTEPLVEGLNTLRYHASDSFGNVADLTRSVTFWVDRIPPRISSPAVTPSSGPAGTSFSLSATVVDVDSRVGSVTATVRNSAGGAVATLAMTRAAGDLFTAGFASAGLGAGVYSVDLAAQDASPQANLQSWTGATSFSITGATVPPAPANLSVVAVSPSTTQLSWQDTASNEDGFHLERKTGPDGAWSVRASFAADSVSAQDGALACSTQYVYRMRSFNAAGDSGPSNEAGLTTAACATPTAPSWLRATASSASQIDLLWQDNSTNEEGFRIERKEGPAGPWTVVASLPANFTSYSDTSVRCGTAWAYRVSAFSGASSSSTTNEAAATPTCACNPSLSPLSSAVSAVGGTVGFTITSTCGAWSVVSDAPWITIPVGASGSGSGSVQLQVARSAVTSARSGVVRIPELGLSFTVDQAAAPADPGFSSFLRLVSGTVAGQTVDPDHRTIHVSPGAAIAGTLNLRIDSAFGSSAVMAFGITPSWGDPAVSYTNLSSFSTPVTALTRAVTFNYTAPSIAGTYHIVAAFRGEFNAGQVLSATNWSVGSLVWNNGDDIAAWTDATLAAANRDGTVLANYLGTGGNVPTWVPATSITVEVGTPQLPAAPTWLRTTASGPTQIDLLWQDNSNNEDSFQIERKQGPAGPWTTINTVPAGTTTYHDTGVTCGTAWAYRVWAVNAAGASAKTNEAGVTPTCP